MNLSSEEGEIPIPISNPIPITSIHGHGHIIHHNPTPKNHIILPSSTTTQHLKESKPYNKVVIKYRECLKNHAAAMGGSALDGCCEFMSGGKEGTLESLKCSACSCHRNFHRKDIDHQEGESSDHNPHDLNKIMRTKSILSQQQVLGSKVLRYPTPTIPSSSETPSPHRVTMSHNLGSSIPLDQSDHEKEPLDQSLETRTVPSLVLKKRFRTKFTQEQKEKLLSFAEKVGWKIQKVEESMVQQICQEIGIKKRVLKVWMHNNKHILGKKNFTSSTTTS